MKKILFLILCTTTSVWCTDLRGTVQGYNSLTQVYYPIDRVTVELGNYDAANRWVRLALSVTDNNGRYYFYGITPGNYLLKIGTNPPTAVNVTNARQQEIPATKLASPKMVFNRQVKQ